MAAAPDPEEVLRSTTGKGNFQRVTRLLISGGTVLLREIFDTRCPPSDLPKILKNPATEKQLKSAKLTKPQWDCLYPSPGVYGKSTDFDVTLLFRLLRTICGLVPPFTGWDALPTSADYTLTADLARIKYYRNSVYGHVNQNMEITDDEFRRLWQEIGEALVRIAGQISPAKQHEWQEAIDNYLKNPLTAEDERNVQELLRWYRNDMEIKESMEELKSSTQDVQEGVGRVETSLKGVQRGLQGTKHAIEENVQCLEATLREGAKDIKDQLEEVHQSIDRLSPSAGGPQAAGVKLRVRIDCEAIAEPGPRAGASEMVVEGGAQAGDQATPVVPIASGEPHAGVADIGNDGIPNSQAVLNFIALKSFRNVDTSKPEELNSFLQYLKDVREVLIVDVQPGSLIITVECSSMEILDGLWNAYCTGHLNEKAQEFLVTDDILKEFGLIEVRLKTTILEEEYKACREYFLQSPGEHSYLATVGIDFGTTYSGFAFSFNKEQREDSIFMNRDWVNELGQKSSKTPTCLLLKSDLTFDSFGYKAVEKYANLSVNEEKDYLFFQHFKMELHNKEDIDLKATLKDVNGKGAEAKTVFAHSIRFLRDEAVNFIRHETGDDAFRVEDILWVLTVPAIWTPRAKQFMREAAYEAGLVSRDRPEQLVIALEPEAAAIFCTQRIMDDDALLSQLNAQYMVVDIGGGTLDVTVHEKQDDGTIKEIYKVTGGPYGGIKVNHQFEGLLDELFGAERLSEYRKRFPADWLHLISDFEEKKRGSHALENKETRIRLPQSFVSSINDLLPLSLKRYGPDEVKVLKDEYLCLSPKVMKKLFEPVLEDMKDHLSVLLSKPELSNVKVMFLVGGFADSTLLQREVKNAFTPRCRVIIPRDAAKAVVQGAVMFGKMPGIITERVVATTYGCACSGDFIEGVHPEEKKFVANGIERCRDLFACFVKENEIVKVGHRIRKVFNPMYADDTEMKIGFYTASHTNAQFITEPGLTQIGSVTVQSPDTQKGLDRDIEVSLYFGGTEITATALDVSSGNVEQTTLDFFCSLNFSRLLSRILPRKLPRETSESIGR